VKCPNCSFDCFAQAKQCECGYSFEIFGRPGSRGAAGAPGNPPAPFAGGEFAPPQGGSTHSSSAANRKIVVGLLLLVGGIAVTAFTYQMAASTGGGQYVVAYGPIIFGAIHLVRGVGESMRE
jgi:hypothetical protein